MGSNGLIFVSYRRDQSRADARSILQHLQAEFGAGTAFMDVDSIQPGEDFRATLARSLKRCKVLLAVMGPDWLDAADEHGRRRLDDPKDFVRIEIASALAREIPVIPVLIDNARMPDARQLPADLQGLVFRQAAPVRHETFGRDLEALRHDIAAILGGARSRWRRKIAAAAGGALALAAVAFGIVYGWPAGRGEQAGAISRSKAAADWSKAVRPASFKVDESPNIGRAEALARRLAGITDGKLTLTLLPPTGPAKPSERIDALSRGTIDAVWETPAAWSERAPVLAIFGGQVPFGLDGPRFARWLRSRGTRELDEVYQRRLGLNVKALHCRIWPAEGIWFRAPLGEPQALAGSALRTSSFFFHRLAERLGLRPIMLPAREIAAALDKGTIAGAEFGSPAGDYEVGLHKVARHYYYPGFHAPASAGFLHLNLDRWNGMDEATRGLVTESCEAQVAADLAGLDEQNQRGLARLKSAGITPEAVPPAVLVAAERAMQQIGEELAKSDADFRRIYTSYLAQR